MFALVASSVGSWDLRQGQKLPTIQQPLGRCRTNSWEAATAQFNQGVWKVTKRVGCNEEALSKILGKMFHGVRLCTGFERPLAVGLQISNLYKSSLRQLAPNCQRPSEVKKDQVELGPLWTTRSKGQVAQCHGRSPTPWWPSSMWNLATDKLDETWWNLMKPV